MISNPCNWFIDGGRTEEFTYEGGNKLYHFSSVDSGISSYFSVNVVFFANGEEHALEVLTRMFKFALDTHIRYEKRKDIEHVHPEILSRYSHRIEEIKVAIKALEEGKCKVTLAPTNQLYKVGWAYNDTLL